MCKCFTFDFDKSVLSADWRFEFWSGRTKASGKKQTWRAWKFAKDTHKDDERIRKTQSGGDFPLINTKYDL